MYKVRASGGAKHCVLGNAHLEAVCTLGTLSAECAHSLAPALVGESGEHVSSLQLDRQQTLILRNYIAHVALVTQLLPVVVLLPNGVRKASRSFRGWWQ